MNAYELADKLETDAWDEATIVQSIHLGIKMLRQQADRIAELEKQTKPLSDEEIETIYLKTLNKFEFARAIEERHGIK
jgi:hypothetical protein